MDWKDMLASLKGDIPSGDADLSPVPDSAPVEEKTAKKMKDTLHVLIEKKGRNGKTATIVEGFTMADEEVDAIASELKKKIGTGGSARGGEILLQGDWREKAAALLREMGFKVKG